MELCTYADIVVTVHKSKQSKKWRDDSQEVADEGSREEDKCSPAVFHSAAAVLTFFHSFALSCVHCSTAAAEPLLKEPLLGAAPTHTLFPVHHRCCFHLGLVTYLAIFTFIVHTCSAMQNLINSQQRGPRLYLKFQFVPILLQGPCATPCQKQS